MKFFGTLAGRLYSAAGKSWFFRATMIVFLVQAIWIALTARYPMAFDEDFHLGIIKLYAHHISPFWSESPAGTGVFGPVARDPSYLFQYLMSFPYRLFSAFTGNQTVIVLLLRAINITLFAGGLVLYRKVLLRTGASRAMANGILAIFVLIPIVPMLAAQINYDNLLLPLFAWTLLLTMSIHRKLVAKELPLTQMVLFVIVCLFTSVVKYAFLPLALGMTVFILWDVYHQRRSRVLTKLNLRSAVTAIPRRIVVAFVFLILLGLGLFMERYGVNIARYHTPIADCRQVLSVSECSAYGPWIRDYNLAANKADNDDTNPITYTGKWIYGMWMRTFFAVDGPSSGFSTRGPLAIPALTGAIVAIGAVAATAYKARALARSRFAPYIGLIGLTVTVYIASLWREEYKAYVDTGQPVAINGRYLLIIAPLLMLVGALAIGQVLKGRPRVKAAFMAIVILGMVWGGGALTYILRSENSWYWPNTTVRSVNHVVKDTLGPVTPGYNKPFLFLHG